MGPMNPKDALEIALAQRGTRAALETVLMKKAAAGSSVAKHLATGLTAPVIGAVGTAAGAKLVSKLFKQPSPMSSAVKGGLMAAGIGGGVAAADAAIDHFKGKHEKKKGFQRLIKENPELGQMDQQKVRTVFNTLHDLAPRVAKNPYMAGSFLKRQMEFADTGMQPQDIKNLVDIDRTQSAKKDSVLRGAFQRATSADMFTR